MKQKIIILVLICSVWFSFTSTDFFVSQALEVTPDTQIGEDDVVKLNYTLQLQKNLGVDVEAINGTVWVHDPNDPQAPSELYEQYQDLTVPPCLGFLEGILGMKAGQEKTFYINWDDGKAFNNVTDPWYGEDLKYNVHIFEILLDATELPFTPFDIPGFIPFLYLILVVFVIIIYYRIKRFSQPLGIFNRKKLCYSCNTIATVRCGNPTCNTPYCKKCFIENNQCALCSSNKMIPFP